MAIIQGTTYVNEADFLSAIAQIKQGKPKTDSADFQAILNQSLSVGTANENTSSNNLDTYFQEAANTYKISLDLLKAVAWQESNYQTDIVSSAGAIGVMQLMPGTANYLGVTNPYDPRENILGGAKLLRELSDKYNGNIDLILAGYNAGTGAVERYGGVPPFSETINFINKIKASLSM